MLASVHCVEAFSVSFALSLELKLNICFWVKSNTCPLCHLLFVLFFAQYPPLSHQEWIRAHNNTLSLWLLNSAPQWRAAMFQHTPLQWHIDCREESRIWGPKVMGWLSNNWCFPRFTNDSTDCHAGLCMRADANPRKLYQEDVEWRRLLAIYAARYWRQQQWSHSSCHRSDTKLW
jgi:hypothetical protein